ncbi:MAG: S8 family serine peptidase [Candidatus Hydrogenedentota bacterium]
MSARMQDEAEPAANRRWFGPLGRFYSRQTNFVMHAMLAIGVAVLIVGCPPEPEPDPDEGTLWDAVPRVDEELLLSSQSGARGGESDLESDSFDPPDLGRDPGGTPEGAANEPLGEEMPPVGVEEPPIFSRAAPRDGQQPVRDWRELRFSSGAHQPEPGLDPALLRAIPALREAGREEVYAFLLMDEYLAGPHYEQLDEIGVEVLGNHGSAYKIAAPVELGAEGLETELAQLDFVHWVGFSPPSLKESPELQRLRDELERAADDIPAEIPVYINLFDEDDKGRFGEELSAQGASLGHYDEELLAYRAMIPHGGPNGAWEVLEAITQLDYVLFVEPMLEDGIDFSPAVSTKHDESTPTIGADYIRPNYDGASITLGIMDTGFMVGSAAPTMHQDLNKFGRGVNFTDDGGSVWNDGSGHGTHVLGTITGTGAADIRYRGVAPGIGHSGDERIRAAQVFRQNSAGRWTGADGWIQDGMDWLTNQGAHVINYSGGGYNNSPLAGTDNTSRRLDANVWESRPLFVVAAGNDGPGSETVGRPAVAKNALAVGNVRDFGFEDVGQIWTSSSRGPTADDRMKPNVTAPGRWIGAADAGTSSGYQDSSGTSMAAPHVAGVAASMMEHYAAFKGRPMLTRARLMATALLHNDDTQLDNANDYGLGRVSSYKAHWRRDNSNGWKGHWAWGEVHENNYIYRDIEVPANAHRLVVVMTWDEPPASSGADAARLWDLELWLQHNPDDAPNNPWTNVPPSRFRSWSWDDNVVYAIIDRPESGTWRLKSVPYDAPHTFWNGYSLPVGIAATVIRGDTQPDMDLSASLTSTSVDPGEEFEIETTVSNPSYILSGVHLENTVLPPGVQLVDVRTTRADGVDMSFGTSRDFTLGNVVQGRSRTVTWTFRTPLEECHDIEFRAWSENGGTEIETVTVCVGDSGDNGLILPPIFDIDPIFSSASP